MKVDKDTESKGEAEKRTDLQPNETQSKNKGKKPSSSLSKKSLSSSDEAELADRAYKQQITGPDCLPASLSDKQVKMGFFFFFF